MRRGAGAAAHGLLLLVALGVLFWDWTRETSPSAERVAIWNLRRSELTSLQLQMPGTTVDLERADLEGFGDGKVLGRTEEGSHERRERGESQ